MKTPDFANRMMVDMHLFTAMSFFFRFFRPEGPSSKIIPIRRQGRSRRAPGRHTDKQADLDAFVRRITRLSVERLIAAARDMALRSWP